MVNEADGVERFSSVLKQRPNYDYKPSIYCRCGQKTPRWISWMKKNPGLRFNKCKCTLEEGGCGFYQFIDSPFPDRANVIIRGLCESEKEQAKRNETLLAEIEKLKTRGMVFNGMVDELLSLKDENQNLTTRVKKLWFMLVIYYSILVLIGLFYFFN